MQRVIQGLGQDKLRLAPENPVIKVRERFEREVDGERGVATFGQKLTDQSALSCI